MTVSASKTNPKHGQVFIFSPQTCLKSSARFLDHLSKKYQQIISAIYIFCLQCQTFVLFSIYYMVKKITIQKSRKTERQQERKA